MTNTTSSTPLLIENEMNDINIRGTPPPPYIEIEVDSIEKKELKWVPNHIHGYIIIVFVIIFVGFFIYMKKR